MAQQWAGLVPPSCSQSVPTLSMQPAVVDSAPCLSYFVYSGVEMSAATKSHASCEVQSVIVFLLVENHKPTEIYCQICDVYGQGIMSESRLRQWCIDLNNG
uniref:Mos1 transposase HTH domain-containing protein n=1 Tax=Cuerna arida TaxID=1464854 RepID=A0A1B6H0A1_9HEMI